MTEDLRAAIDGVLPAVRADLDRLIRIPSVSAPGFDPAHVRASGEATAEILEASGLEGVRLLEIEGVHPAVFGHRPGSAGTPTVLLYAHHDVQPQGDESDWDTPPFEPVERDGRLYGRGSADDKAGIAVHAAALRAHDGKPPLGVTVFIEGEEEIGSLNLDRFLSTYGDLLAADVLVIADSANWRVGQPAITTSLRGLVDCIVEVRTLDHALHSGQYGGTFPDALTVLSRLLATLHDDEGRVAIPGLVSSDMEPLDLTEKELREQAASVPGVELIGEGSLTSRLWTRPAVSVLGIDAPSIQESANKLIPSARAKVSLRLAPGQNAERAMDALVGHLEAHVPWGADVRVERGAVASPFSVDARGPAFEAFRSAFLEAWGTPPVDVGQGGTIPLTAEMARAFPEAAILITGMGDPDTRAHGSNESLHLGDFEKSCLAEAIFLGRLAT